MALSGDARWPGSYEQIPCIGPDVHVGGVRLVLIDAGVHARESGSGPMKLTHPMSRNSDLWQLARAGDTYSTAFFPHCRLRTIRRYGRDCMPSATMIMLNGDSIAGVENRRFASPSISRTL